MQSNTHSPQSEMLAEELAEQESRRQDERVTPADPTTH